MRWLDIIIAKAFSGGGSSGGADTEQNIEWVEASQMPEDGAFNIAYTNNNGTPNMNAYIRKIIVPKGVLGLAEGCFWGCTKLETIILPDTLKGINPGAFNGCLSLKKITIPGIYSISGGTFTGTPALEEIELEEGIVKISAGAFAGTVIKSITIPSTVDYIDSIAFPGITTLTEINVLAPKAQVEGADKAPWGATNATVNWING